MATPPVMVVIQKDTGSSPATAHTRHVLTRLRWHGMKGSTQPPSTLAAQTQSGISTQRGHLLINHIMLQEDHRSVVVPAAFAQLHEARLNVLARPAGRPEKVHNHQGAGRGALYHLVELVNCSGLGFGVEHAANGGMVAS